MHSIRPTLSKFNNTHKKEGLTRIGPSFFRLEYKVLTLGVVQSVLNPMFFHNHNTEVMG